MVLNRQRRLDLLSAVPLERRHDKDFEAAFGENPEDVTLTQRAAPKLLNHVGSTSRVLRGCHQISPTSKYPPFLEGVQFC